MEDEDVDLGASGRAFGTWHVVGAIAIAAGFAITLEDVSVSWAGDRVTAHYRNWGALGGGAVAIVAGAIALARLGSVQRSARALAGVLGVLVLAGGGYQVARGLGVFFHAERPPSFRMADEPPVPPPLPAPTVDAAPPIDARPAYADLDQAAEALRAACHDDQSAPCVQWRDAIAKACKAGSPTSCGNLAIAMLSPPVGGPADDAGGRAAAAQACTLGNESGCTSLSYALHKGLGGPVDLPGAHVAAAKACAAEDRSGCQNLATYLQEDPGVSDDEKLAGLDTACFEGAILPACGGVADILVAKKTRTADEDKHLRSLLAHACRLEGDQACADYAAMLDAGQGGPVHPELAAAVRAHACHIGHATSCAHGERPARGAVVIIDGVNPIDPEEYETVPALDRLEAALVPCATLPGATDAKPSLRMKITSSGDVTYPTEDLDGLPPALADCIAKNRPTTVTGLAVPDRLYVSFNVILSFGTMK